MSGDTFSHRSELVKMARELERLLAAARRRRAQLAELEGRIRHLKSALRQLTLPDPAPVMLGELPSPEEVQDDTHRSA